MKRVCCFILVLSMILGIISLTGCQKHDELKTEKTVMHLSLNPEIEVVLDEEDKVITVNALNEEGNLTLSGGIIGTWNDDFTEITFEDKTMYGFLLDNGAPNGYTWFNCSGIKMVK